MTGQAVEASGGTLGWVERPGGVRLRVACWPEGARGVVLLLQGRKEFIEKYLEPVAELQARGFAVWTLDWRGQGASSRLLADPAMHHVDDFGDYAADLDDVLDRLVLPSLRGRRLVMLAHSMGGAIGAAALARRPAVFERAVLSAPMLGVLRKGRRLGRAAGWLVRVAARWPGQAVRFAPGPGRGVAARPFEGNPLTGCAVRYAADQALLAAAPGLAVGGITWGWLRAALRAMAALRDPAVLARIKMPVLVTIGTEEALVDNRAIRRFTMRLPRGKLLVFRGARHEVLREVDVYRQGFWAAFDAFVGPAP